MDDFLIGYQIDDYYWMYVELTEEEKKEIFEN